MRGSSSTTSTSFDSSFGNPRPIYYTAMAVIIILISIIIHLGQPAQLVLLSGNLSNLAALIFPVLLIIMNLRLPRPAKTNPLAVLILVANTIFFGFFFINFLVIQITGQPLLRF